MGNRTAFLAGKRYLKLLAGLPGIKPVIVRQDRTSVWGQFTLKVDDRDSILEKLRAADIPAAGIHYPIPLYRQPAYQVLCRISGSLENADAVAAKVISLPMHPYIDLETQTRIIEAIS